MGPASPTDERVLLQGIGVDALDLPSLLDRVDGLVRARGKAVVTYVNVHVLNVAAGDPDLTAFLQNADVCFCDGVGVVIGARLQGKDLPKRMTGADWIWSFAERAAKERWRIAWVGGLYGVSAKAAAKLAERQPGFEVVLATHGYTPPSGPAHEALLAQIEAAKPDILLVGMGTPIQERWVAANRDRLSAPVVWCLGATADFVSGRVSRGPAFLHQNQEWLARLLVEPRRLWRRYLIGNPRFLLRMAREGFRRSDG